MLFQTTGRLFEPFFRYGFGRRYFLLGRNIALPFLLIVLAVVLRTGVPGLSYFPFALMEPEPRRSALLNSLMVVDREQPAFAAFAVLFVVLALLHYVVLWGQRLLRRDPAGTTVWGSSWIRLLPGFKRLSQSFVQGKLEPLIVIAAGYYLLAQVPVFAVYLMVGGAVFGWDNLCRWRRHRARALDARDAIYDAELQRDAHAVARAHAEEVAARSRGRAGRATEVRIEKRRRPFWR